MRRGNLVRLARARRRRQDDELRKQVVVPDETAHPVGVATATRRQNAIDISGSHIRIFGLGMP